ncbi:MAG: hypothetical protein WCJ64_04580 [Rhodospirillaceae bacterium]
MANLTRDYLAAIRAVGWDDTATPAARWLAARGMDARRRLHVGGIGAARAVFHERAGIWEQHPEGERVLALPVFDGAVCHVIEDGEDAGPDTPELFDLIAWRPADPTRLYRRTGEAALVGVGGIDASLETGAALRVFGSIEAFIVAGGEIGAGAEPVACGIHGEHRPIRPAAVIFDLARAAPLLRLVPEIIAPDLALAEQVEAAIRASVPKPPRLMIDDPRRAAA